MRVACLILFLLANTCRAQKTQQEAIAFYNVENLFDTIDNPNTDDDAFTPKGAYNYTQAIYNQKLHNTAYVLQQLSDHTAAGGPVLIGLAEIENERVLKDLLSNIKPKKYNYVWYDSHDPRGIDVAMLYDPKRFTVISGRPVEVNIMHNGVHEPTRDILYVTGLLGHDTMHILANHWPSRRDGKGETAHKRAQAALKNKHLIDSLMKQNSKNKIIVMGDLNDDPTDESVHTILAASDDQDVVAGILYNPWKAIYRSGIGTTAFQKKWNLFDQIIISSTVLQNGKGWRFKKAEIFNKDFLITHSGKQGGYPFRSWRGYKWMNGYSDHLPVILYLEK